MQALQVIDTDTPLNAAEHVAASLNLHTPVRRLAFGTAVGTILTWAVQPRALFYDDGTPKPWAATADPDVLFDNGGEAAPIPWWMPALGLGVAFSTFV